MSFLTEIDGWTPVVDALVKEHGLVTAAVFGAVWRYCQMEDRVCSASLEVIGERLKLDKATVMRHIKVLCDDGYLKDLTPARRNAPHVYADTGKAKIVGSIQAATALESHTKRGQTVAQDNSYIMEEGIETVEGNNSSRETVAQDNSLPQTVAECNATVAESQLKRVFKKDSIISSKNGTVATGEDTKPPKEPTEKQKESWAMFTALANLCKYDLDVIRDGPRKALNQAAKYWREKGATPDDIRDFGLWWYENDWRGKKGQPPILSQIRDTWGQFKDTRQPKRMVLK